MKKNYKRRSGKKKSNAAQNHRTKRKMREKIIDNQAKNMKNASLEVSAQN